MSIYNKDDVTAFLADLSALTLKHGIKIDGCGCCGSPYLSDLTQEEKDFEYKAPQQECLSWSEK
jgi:hypothetical protein